MERRQKRNFFTQLIFSKVFIGVGTLFLILIIIGLSKSWASNYQVNAQMNKLEDQIANLEGENRDLTDFLSYLQTNDFVAREGRTKLGLKNAGENLVIVKDEEVTKMEEIKKQQEEQQQLATANKSNWQKWLDYFLK
jgi:cell division protein FtsB